MKRILLGLVLVLLAALPQPQAGATTFRLPVPGRVVRPFLPPEFAWQPGHRGVDLSGNVGAVVRAPAAGTVTFAGSLAGRDVVVVSHGSVRSTYEPISPRVRVGQEVAAGDMLGLLEAGHSCPAPHCLHWGLRRGTGYLDPLAYFAGDVVLVPVVDSERARAQVRSLPESFRRPALGPIRAPREPSRLPARGRPGPQIE